LLRAILNQKQAQVIKEEREMLTRLQVVLAGFDVTPADQKTLQDSLRQLDELFLLVIVGEFNSGKSAFINALLGEYVFTEGVTPTTARIHLLHHAQDREQKQDNAGLIRIGNPADFLRDINIVDTPGTNAIIREHEQLTQEFVPRSDLVIFVTSSDRPFTESERLFMGKIREWGKKVIIVLNKTDQLQKEEVTQIIQYIKENALALLGFTPEIFPVSARLAMRAKSADNQTERQTLWAASQFAEVENYILHTLDEKSRVQLKLMNPLGIADQLISRYRDLARSRLELLASDLAAIDNIENQLSVYQQDLQHDFRYRLSDVERILLAMSNRGMLFFDDTIRLGRMFDLVNAKRIQSDFEQRVVEDAPRQIEHEVQSLIDWMIDRDLRQWQSTLEYLDYHLAKIRDEQDKIIGKVGGSFANNRRALLESVGRAAREVMRTYDREEEGRKLAAGLRDALAGTALVEVGAVSLGVILVTVLNTAFLDFTGILAAGSLAVVGFLILPAKKRRAKNALAVKLEDLRQRLLKAMTGEFDSELEHSLQRLREAISPYTRFVRAEQQKLGRIEAELAEVEQTTKAIHTEIKF